MKLLEVIIFVTFLNKHEVFSLPVENGKWAEEKRKIWQENNGPVSPVQWSPVCRCRKSFLTILLSDIIRKVSPFPQLSLS